MDDDSAEPPACFSCTLQVNQTIHVKCSECTVRICMLCFQCGAESPPHRRGHNYELLRPSDDGDGMTWTHEDEFELLKAAHKFKMGNWGEIAESIGRDGHNCKDYFERHFVRGWIGQFSIKSANWDKVKFEMFDKQNCESVLQKSCLESTERMLMIRDAIRDSGDSFDENDPKLAVKVQQLLESYVKKCINNEIEIKYEMPKELKGQYETDLALDDCDPDKSIGGKPRKSVKLEVQTDDSDNGNSPGPSCSYSRSGPPSPKKRKTTRVVRESSSDSEERKSVVSDNGIKRESDEEDGNGTDFETAQEFDSDDEEEEKTPKKGCPAGRRKRKTILKRGCASKKDRRLQEFRKKMNREQKLEEKKLATLSRICSKEELTELRQDFPRLLHELNSSKLDRPKIKRGTELNLLGYNIEREEFETEWFNEAEALISRLTISAAPPEADQKLDIENDIKFARLRHYVRLLGIRKAKRNTVLEHDKINEFIRWYKEACLLSKTKSMTEIMDSRNEKEKLLAMTQQFLRRDEYQNLRNCIEKIDGIVERIEVLQDLQRNGETSLRNAPIERKSKKKMRKIDCEQKKKIATEWSKFKKWHTEGWQ